METRRCIRRFLVSVFSGGGRKQREARECHPPSEEVTLLLIFHPNTRGAEGLFHEKFLPFKNLHILIQENKEKLSYTLEEDHYSIPTIPKARRQPAAGLIGALWG